MLALASACQSPPGTLSESPSQRLSRHLALLVSYEIIVLNPEDPRDLQVMRAALEREHSERARTEYRWLPTTPRDGQHGYSDLVAHADDMETRRRLRSCLRVSRASPDTSITQVLVLRVHVAGDGNVLEAGVITSTLKDSDVMSCLLQNVAEWKFGRKRGDATFDVPLALVPTPYQR